MACVDSPVDMAGVDSPVDMAGVDLGPVSDGPSTDLLHVALEHLSHLARIQTQTLVEVGERVTALHGDWVRTRRGWWHVVTLLVGLLCLLVGLLMGPLMGRLLQKDMLTEHPADMLTEHPADTLTDADSLNEDPADTDMLLYIYIVLVFIVPVVIILPVLRLVVAKPAVVDKPASTKPALGSRVPSVRTEAAAYNDELSVSLDCYVRTIEVVVAPVATSSPLAGVLWCLGYRPDPSTQSTEFAGSEEFVSAFVDGKGQKLLDKAVPELDDAALARLVDAAGAALLQVAENVGFDRQDLLEDWMAANRAPCRSRSSRGIIYKVVLVCILELYRPRAGG
jgi:hypothetical protein